MKILIIHNRYLFAGGEDRIVESESRLLKKHGHDIVFYIRSNQEAYLNSRFQQIQCLGDGITWSRKSYEEISSLIRREKPDIAHFHNPFFMMSPSAYSACYDCGVPIVQSLHNYRFLCANGVFFRDGKICDICLRGGGRQAVFKKCIHHAFSTSLVSAAILRTYRKHQVLRKKVSAFIAPSQFCKDMYCSYGKLDPQTIYVKPHFIEDPGCSHEKGSYVLYVGALREYKGFETLLKAWKKMEDFPLKIVGGESADIQCSVTGNVEFLGKRSMAETIEIIKGAICVIVPSMCYETFARVIIEAYACGKPVVVSDLGALTERVIDGKTGLLFEPGNSDDLVLKVRRVLDNEEFRDKMGRQAHQEYQKTYTAQKNYDSLINIYQSLDCAGSKK